MLIPTQLAEPVLSNRIYLHQPEDASSTLTFVNAQGHAYHKRVSHQMDKAKWQRPHAHDITHPVSESGYLMPENTQGWGTFRFVFGAPRKQPRLQESVLLASTPATEKEWLRLNDYSHAFMEQKRLETENPFLISSDEMTRKLFRHVAKQEGWPVQRHAGHHLQKLVPFGVATLTGAAMAMNHAPAVEVISMASSMGMASKGLKYVKDLYQVALKLAR
jgi:hypothetical protein